MFRGKSYEGSLRLSLRDHTIVQSSLGRGMEAMEEEDSAEWQATILGLVASTGLEACQVERIDELKDCVALCALSEELMVQLDLVTTEELCELRAHDNIKLPERLKLYLEVFETDAGWVPFVDCDKTVESICNGDEERLIDLCAWIFERYTPGQGAVAEGVEEARAVLAEVPSAASKGDPEEGVQGGAKAFASIATIVGAGGDGDEPASSKRAPAQVSLKLGSITEDNEISIAMYAVENDRERLRCLLESGGASASAQSPGSEAREAGEDAQGENGGLSSSSLALFPWTHQQDLCEGPLGEADLLGLARNFGISKEENSSRALHKHLTSWMRRLDALREEGKGSAIADCTQFRDGAVLCKLIQLITGRRVLGGIQAGGDKFESVSNISRGFQSLWSFMLHNELDGFRSGFEFYPESIVKGNDRDTWSFIHFLYKLYLHSKGEGGKSVTKQAELSSIPQNLVTFQSVFDKILTSSLEDLKLITNEWLGTQPLIASGGEGTNIDFKSGSILCQLMSLYNPVCLYSSPILEPKNYHRTFARDNICVGLIALEQVLQKRIGKTQVGKFVSNNTVEKITAGDMLMTLKAVALTKLCFQWRDGTFKSSSFIPSVHRHASEIKVVVSETEKKIIAWINNEMELKVKSMGMLMKKLKAGNFFVRLAERATKLKLFELIMEDENSNEVRDESMRAIFKGLASVQLLSKQLTSAAQSKLLAGDRQAWLNLLECLYQASRKPSTKQQSRATYTRLGQRIKPESNKVDMNIGLSVSDRAFQNLMAWIKSKIYIPNRISVSDFFRDGRSIARLIQVIGRAPLRGIDFAPTSYSAINQNIEVIIKFLNTQNIDTSEYSVHQLASGDEEMITHLLCSIKEWHRQISPGRRVRQSA